LETALIGVATPGVAEEQIAPEEFEAIVRDNQRRIYRLLLAMLRDSDEADNLTQECFLRAFRKRAGYRGEAGIATWLTRIAIAGGTAAWPSGDGCCAARRTPCGQ